jgi:hypothetical protein
MMMMGSGMPIAHKSSERMNTSKQMLEEITGL